ncbi:MAG: diacylglycerol kinase family lipid kinase [Candidatus Cloacimonetes bacterium]|nr:diacylglycerol kinase family lipid kinase [Candidatus Cloacimonadota bacterium]MCF7814054.1 diacylglycerol kinase family lipid kinase [Candidatus Cloacimonadota bacterium]MCF7868644.1 diacylglycerol kinase family lipid kinase [Candidatus Cloacimonadota bacterium]MCF7884099.1 diacylglycerol kinase family lipid kinase [Candidatus Cloacimonadota bacterium]
MNTKWFLIANATAGRGKTGRKISELIKSLNEHKFDFEIELTKTPLHATELAKEAIKKEYRKIVVVGGDGTLNETVNGIMQSGKQNEIKLGLIPEGGGNDFAMNFKLSNNIDKAIELLKREKTCKVDIGKIEDYFFINALGLGFDAQVALISRSIKHLNGLPRYLVAVIRALVKLQKFEAEITLDNCTLKKPFLLFSIGNGLSTGGGFLLTPEARVNDGLLDICLIQDVTRRRILSLLPKAIKGQHLKEPEVIIHQSKKIHVKTDKKLPIYFDGELPELKHPFNFTIEILPKQIEFITG